MKELSKYQCEYCHTEYREKTACERCEKNHKVKLKITKKVYQPYETCNSGTPCELTSSLKTVMLSRIDGVREAERQQALCARAVKRGRR